MKGDLFVALVAILANLSIIQCHYCERVRKNSVTSAYDVVSYGEMYRRCWNISVPDNEVANVRIKIFDIVSKNRCQTTSGDYWGSTPYSSTPSYSRDYWWSTSGRYYSTSAPYSRDYWQSSSRNYYSTPPPYSRGYWWSSSRRDYPSPTPSSRDYWQSSSRSYYSTPPPYSRDYWQSSSRRDYSSPSPPYSRDYWWSTSNRDYSSPQPSTRDYWWSTSRRDYSSPQPSTRDYWWSTSRREYSTSPPAYRTSPNEYFSKAVVIVHTLNESRSYVFYPSNDSSSWITIRGNANITLLVDNTFDWCISNQKVILKIEHKTVSGIRVIKGVDETRNKLATWIKSRFLPPLKWKENIQRAVVALHLSDGVNFTRTGLMEELLIKQVDLKSSVALLRNSSDPMSINKLAITVNALLATCHNPRHFYGYDLIQILKDDVELSQSTSPSAYLALCNANETISVNAIDRLQTIANEMENQPFIQDIQAITVMALSCIRRRNSELRKNIEPYYRDAISELRQEQLEDGSFGNIYSTAIITQALLSDDERNETDDAINAAIKYLVHHFNTSDVDFTAAYYSLPLLNQKTLVDIGFTDCSKNPRKGDGISDMEDKLGPKIKVQYSLFIGDKKDITSTMSFRVPQDVTAYEVMRLAATADPKYKFKWIEKSGKMYVYQMSNIPNDPEEGHFWFTYYRNNDTLVDHLIKSPDKVQLHDGYHLILWYKSLHLVS